jgi:hypothetical protein
MKKAICLFAAVLFLSVTTQSFAQLKFGAVAGLNFPSMSTKSLPSGVTKKTTVSFNLGGIAEYSLSDVYGLQSGLILSGKGLTIEQSPVKQSISPLYLEIPINAYYKLNVGNYKVHLFAGPYLAFGIGGRIETTGAGSSNKSADIKFGTATESDMKGTDLGLNIGAGMEVKNLLITLQYGMGLTNLDPQGASENEFKNNVLGLSVAYIFGAK